MSSLQYLGNVPGAAFTSVGDDGTGADVPIPVLARSLQEARARIRGSYLADDVRVRAIDASPYGSESVLLIVRFDDERQTPTLLMFRPHPDDLPAVQAELREESREQALANAKAQALDDLGGWSGLEAVLEAAHGAIDDASGVVDPGEDETRAYDKELARVTTILVAVRDASKRLDTP